MDNNHKKIFELSKNIRIHALKMANKGGSSHIASVFSMADIIAVLYENILQYLYQQQNSVSKHDTRRVAHTRLHEC